jgi:small subunit ribosomal protein S4
MNSSSNSRFRRERLCEENISGSPKSSFHKRPFKPGQHGKNVRKKRASEYSVQRNAIRILSTHYGSDLGHTLRFGKILRYARTALATKTENSVQAFMQNFELRLDTAIYRLKWAPSMRAARQMLSHGKSILLDGKRVTCGHMHPGQTISLTDAGAESQNFALGQALPYNQVPDYYSCEGKSATLLRIPAISEVQYPCKINSIEVLKFCRKRS